MRGRGPLGVQAGEVVGVQREVERRDVLQHVIAASGLREREDVAGIIDRTEGSRELAEVDVAVAISPALGKRKEAFALVALAIRLTSAGPVLYRQTRVGLEGRWAYRALYRTLRRTACGLLAAAAPFPSR